MTLACHSLCEDRAQSSGDAFSKLLSLLQSEHFREVESLHTEIVNLNSQIKAQRCTKPFGQLSTTTDVDTWTCELDGVCGVDMCSAHRPAVLEPLPEPGAQESISPRQLDLNFQEVPQERSLLNKELGNSAHAASQKNGASTCVAIDSGDGVACVPASSVRVASPAEPVDMFDEVDLKAVDPGFTVQNVSNAKATSAAVVRAARAEEDGNVCGSQMVKRDTELSCEAPRRPVEPRKTRAGDARKSMKLSDLAVDARKPDYHFQDLQQQIRKTNMKRARATRRTRMQSTINANQDMFPYDQEDRPSITGSVSSSGRGSKKQKSLIVRISLHPSFDLVSACAILLNSALIGVITQHQTYGNAEEMWMEVTAWSLASYFFVELTIRWFALGVSEFFCGEEKVWNVFDLLLVLVSIVELIIQSIGGDSSSMPLLNSGTKILKMLRIMRIFRVFRFFRELSLLALMIMDSIKSLFWALLMIGIILYVFAICFTQQAAEYVKTAGVSDIIENIEKKFGSLQSSTYWLICSMLGGVSWHEVSDLLFEIGWVTAAFFLVYIFFAMLCVLNIITGVFVDNAVATAELERDFLVEKELELKAKYIRELKNLFSELDTDDSGSITWEEFHGSFQDPRVASYFTAIGLHTDDLERLWTLIDDDKSGNIDVQEFLDGCQRLRGEARSIDVQTVLHECRRIQSQLDKMMNSKPVETFV